MLDDDKAPIAEFKNLKVVFETKDGTVTGVEDVSFSIYPGETVCVVGESGSGKSVSSLSMMRLVEFGGGKIQGGELNFEKQVGGKIDLANASQKSMRHTRGNEIGMIFQEPMTSLNPYQKVGYQIDESLIIHRGLSKKEARKKTLDLLKKVGLDPLSVSLKLENNSSIKIDDVLDSMVLFITALRIVEGNHLCLEKIEITDSDNNGKIFI